MTAAAAALETFAADLATRLPGQVERFVALADLTTYRIGGPASVLVRARSIADAQLVAQVLASIEGAGVPVLVVGRGSNLLVADDGFPGIAIHLEGDLEGLRVDSSASVVEAGAGLALPVLARRAAAAGLAGLEFFVGIPGSVGGAVRMNAGGHGRDTASVLVTATIISLDTGAVSELSPVDLVMGYRDTNLRVHDLVVSATFTVTADDIDACEARIAEIVRWRREHQPGGANAGSVFTNPDGDSAGRLVDACGLKGLRVGAATVSDKHANFFQADPGATASDVRALIDVVQQRVHEATGVTLVPELRMVGFHDSPG
jgi:UDP-N-acetylmuramate dehydrogenase